MKPTEILTKIAPAMVNTRAVANDDREIWAAIASNELKKLVGPWHVYTSDFDQLAWYEKRIVYAYSAARSATQAILVGRSAGRVHGIWVVSLTSEKVELALPNRTIPAKSRWDDQVRYRNLVLADEDVTSWLGIRITTKVRTVVDIACLHGFAEGLVAFDWALQEGISAEQLSAMLVVVGRRKGIASARNALRHATHKSESPYESLARALLLNAGITNVQPQVWIGEYRVDLRVGHDVIVEIDGDLKYRLETERSVKEELDRQKILMNKGYRIVRYSPQRLRDDPEQFVAEVKAAGAVAA